MDKDSGKENNNNLGKDRASGKLRKLHNVQPQQLMNPNIRDIQVRRAT